MGDLRAGTGGSDVAQPTGKRVARHAAEQVADQPYVGRRVARARPGPARRRSHRSGRRRADPPRARRRPPPRRRGRRPRPVADARRSSAVGRAVPVRDRAPSFVAPPEPPFPVVPDVEIAGRRAPVAGAVAREHRARPRVADAPTFEPARPFALHHPRGAPGRDRAGRATSRLPPPIPTSPARRAPRRRPATRRPAAAVARRRVPDPAAERAPADGRRDPRPLGRRRPPGDAPRPRRAAAAHHLAPASALSGSSAVASANLLGGRGTVVSRELRPAPGRRRRAGQAARPRPSRRSPPRRRSRPPKIKLHQWVLPGRAPASTT